MSRIKKFVIYNIFLSFILVGSLYTLSWIYVNYIDEYRVKFLELERKNIRNLKIINIGSSHTTYGIKYPKDIKGYNMGLSDQTFYYDFEILKKYYKRLDENCIIIIPISIFSFTGGLKSNIYAYTNFLSRKTLFEVDNKEYFLNKYFTSTQPITRIYKVFKYIIVSLKNRKFEKNYIIYPKDLSFVKKVEEAIATKQLHLGFKYEDKVYNKNIGIDQLKKILKFCEEKNFKPILISTPQTYLYNEQIGEKNYQERIYNNIKEIEKQMNTKYLYLDYSHDKRFENNLEYFSDDDHLNKKGAKYFTEILLNDIESHGYNVK